MSNPKNDINYLRSKVKKLEKGALNSTTLDNLSASFEDKIRAVNEGVGAVAGSLLNVSSSLSVSLETAASALQAGLEANAGALLNVSSSLSVSLDQAKAALQGALEANIGAVLGDIDDLSGSVRGTIKERSDALQAGLTNIVDVLLPDVSSSLKDRSDALSGALSALIDVTLPDQFGDVETKRAALSASLHTLVTLTLPDQFGQVETKRQNLSQSLSELVNSNSGTFSRLLDGLDGEVNGILDDITIITGSWEDFTSSVNSHTQSVNTNILNLNEFKITAAPDLTDLKSFKTANIAKLSAMTSNAEEEKQHATNSVGTEGAQVNLIKSLPYITTFNFFDVFQPPANFWAYSVNYPTGTNPFSIKSYSYMGTSAGTKFWNLEEIISYSKREYSIKTTALGYDPSNTMIKDGSGNSIVTKDSVLSLKADKIQIEKGRTNLASSTLTIIGETADADGSGDDQGQLFIRDEDNTTAGLMIGYKYVDSSNQYARMQAKNSAGTAADLYLNPAGGSVKISRLGNHYLTDGTIELNYHGVGNRNTFIDFHSDDYYGRPGSNPNAGGDGDYSGRIIRWLASDGMLELVNRGNGGIRNTVVGGTGNIFDWYVNSTRLMYLNSNGNLTIAGAYSPSSDERIKTDILTSSLGLQFINQLNPVQFKYIIADEIIDITKEKIENNKIVNDGTRKRGVRNHYGFIAQQVKKAAGDGDFAGVIYESEKDLYKLNHQEFISPMVKAIQELSQKNDYLEKKLEEKDKQLQDILLRLSALESK